MTPTPVPKMTPIRSDNEVLLLKAAKDLISAWWTDPPHSTGRGDLAAREAFDDAMVRLRRAVELAEGEENADV